ncbi:MAG: NUDIX hydrolase [Thermodesulfobacteriota bacterium]
MDERTYPDRPWLGVGGIVFHGDEVLLVKRGKEPGKGRWSIPGGAVDTGETLKEALYREIEEETGLSVEVLDLVEILERIIPDSRGTVLYHYVLMDYCCVIKGGQLKAQSDADEAGFFALGTLNEIDIPEITRQVIHKAFQKNHNFLLDKNRKR